MTNEFKNTSFLGTGWSFPPTFSRVKKTVEMVSQVEDINQSLELLLGTRLGERIMQPSYGSKLDSIIFESLTATLKTVTKDAIETAILYHEPRIDLDKVHFLPRNELQGVVMIELIYTVRATNSRYNYVFPFYLNEGERGIDNRPL